MFVQSICYPDITIKGYELENILSAVRHTNDNDVFLVLWVSALHAHWGGISSYLEQVQDASVAGQTEM